MQLLSTLILFMFLFLCVTFGTHAQTPGQPASKSGASAFKISSPAFADGASIPKPYTCSSDNYSPALKWENTPQGTKSFAIIMDDPDAPVGTFVHWVIYNIPAEQTSLAEKASPKGALPVGAIEGKNHFSRIGYGGPCPPPGKAHRYFFKLYALDSTVSLAAGAAKEDLLQAMKDHILGQAQIMGLFAR